MNKDITPIKKNNPMRKAVVSLRDISAAASGTVFEKSSPAPSVICFIKQFARCYTYNNSMPDIIGGINAN